MKTEPTEDIKVGDYAEIVPDDKHTEYIKNQYGKMHKVTRIATSSTGLKLYKLKGVKGYGTQSSIRKLK
jgi:hypothetical protein